MSMITREPLVFSSTVTWWLVCFLMICKYFNDQLPEMEMTIMNLLPVQTWIMFSICFYWLKTMSSPNAFLIASVSVVLFVIFRIIVSYRLPSKKSE